MRSARLFAAIALSSSEKSALFAVSQVLKEKCDAGRFPAKELLHITLHFFGQTPLDKLSSIETAIRQAAAGNQPFELTTGRAGTFGRGDSSVLWLGLEGGSAELKALQSRLETALTAAGFAGEGREFKAHITLGRDVRINQPAGEIELPKCIIKASGITLMESTQKLSKPAYVPLLFVPF